MRTFFAGIASICAATVTHPIDTLKIRLQIQGEVGSTQHRAYKNIFQGFFVVVHNEGVKGLYKGITASWMRESIYSSLRLGLYEPFKRALGADDSKKHTPFYLKFLAAGMSGFIGSALANPTDLLKVRMQASEGTSHGIVWHVKDVYA